MKKIEKTIKNCLRCSKEFLSGGQKNKKYCSVVCYHPTTFDPKIKIKVCPYCNNSFEIPKHRKRTYCSVSCFAKCLAEKNIKTRHNKGLYTPKEGKKILLEKYGGCQKCGWKDVPGVFEIHHMDHNKKNNRLTNFELLCANCHARHHYETGTGRFSNNIGRKKLK